MKIPIFEEDEKVGMLRVAQEGLYTLFAARLPPTVGADAPGGPHDGALGRLWLLNEKGNAASLGLLEPCESGRVLSRRLTRLECSRLPAAPVKALVLPNGDRPKLPGKEEEGRQRVAPTGEKTNSERRIPNSEFAWRLLSDGSLVEPKRRLLALPWAGERLPDPGRKIMVRGKEYLLFRY